MRATPVSVQRFGCAALGIDPVTDHLTRAIQTIAAQNLGERVEVTKGKIEAIPARSVDFDYIWCRDMLNHVPDLRKGLLECARVLRPRGKMLSTRPLQPTSSNQGKRCGFTHHWPLSRPICHLPILKKWPNAPASRS